MPHSPEDLAKWKERYGYIYSVSARGVEYVFRELTYAEHDVCINVERNEGSAEAEDKIVEIALLSTDPVVNFDRIPAGVISSLSEEVLELSGFASPRYARSILNEYRETVGSSFRTLMKAFILSTMPAYKEEELDQLTFRKMAEKLVLAEQIIKVNQNAFGNGETDMKLDLIDPEEEALRQQAEVQKHAAQKKPGQAGFNDPIADKLRASLGE